MFIESIETVKCLDEGVIESVADANIGSIFGIGFPGWTGGVLQYINGYEGGPAGFVARARELARDLRRALRAAGVAGREGRARRDLRRRGRGARRLVATEGSSAQRHCATVLRSAPLRGHYSFASCFARAETHAPKFAYFAAKAAFEASVVPRSSLHSLAAFVLSCLVGLALAVAGRASAADQRERQRRVPCACASSCGRVSRMSETRAAGRSWRVGRFSRTFGQLLRCRGHGGVRADADTAGRTCDGMESLSIPARRSRPALLGSRRLLALAGDERLVEQVRRGQ